MWRYLTSVCRAGQAHNIDSILTHRRPGSLAVRCPACPELGFNVSAEHVATKFLSVDGNYRLVHELNGNKDPDDVALTNGGSYFVRWVDFDEFLQVASLKPEEVYLSSACGSTV